MRALNIFIFLVATIYFCQLGAQAPNLSGNNFFNDGTGNIVNITDGLNQYFDIDLPDKQKHMPIIICYTG